MAELYSILKPENTYYDRKNVGVGKDYQNVGEYFAALDVSTTVYVGNLSFYTSQDSIRELFSYAGKVTNIIMGINEEGHPCGFCFVVYTTQHTDSRPTKKPEKQSSSSPKPNSTTELSESTGTPATKKGEKKEGEREDSRGEKTSGPRKTPKGPGRSQNEKDSSEATGPNGKEPEREITTETGTTVGGTVSSRGIGLGKDPNKRKAIDVTVILIRYYELHLTHFLRLYKIGLQFEDGKKYVLSVIPSHQHQPIQKQTIQSIQLLPNPQS